MIGKKINQLATELAPVSTDLTIIGDPTTGVSKKITLAQLGAIFSGAVSFYNDLASFPATGDINVIYCAKDTQKLYLWSGSAYTEVFPSQALLDTYQLRSEKGVSNGYASLDSSGKVPISQLPSSIMEYKGTWNAATNTPTLANGTGDTGDVYICNVAGTVNFGAGPITFAVGDYVIYSGSIWQRSSGAVGTVTSVAATITGDAIGITGSPVTTSGTLAFAFAGTGAQYIKGDGTLATFPNTIAQATNLITEVYNSTGATLTKGTIVYINGGQGNLPTVTKALATGDSTSAQTFGVVQADITNNNNGYVVVAGKLSDLDTQAYTEGTQLYLSSTTAGAWTSTKQYAPAHLVYVGIVVRSHPTQGIVEIKIQNGYELDELHNVAAQTPTNNDGLFWEASTSLWKNKSISTILGGTPITGSGNVNAIPKFTDNSVLGNSVMEDDGNFVSMRGLKLNASAGVGNTINFQQGTGITAGGLGYSTIGASSTTGFIFYIDQNTTSRNFILDTSTITSDAQRTYSMPDTSGTLALVSQLTGGTVTSVGLSSATSGVTIGSSPITTSGTITLAIATASGSQQGLLSSTDWTTFNNKQNALTNPVTGTGTTNYLPKFTGTSTIGNSIIQEDTNTIGINTTGYTIGAGYTALGINNATNGGAIDLLLNNVKKGEFYITSTSFNMYGFAGVGINLTVDNNASKGLFLNTSGNLGLGVTPSAWNSGYKVMDISAWGSIAGEFGTQGTISLVSNCFANSTGYNNWTYVNTAPATRYKQYNGEHQWYNAPSGTAGNAISFTQAMTLNASGNLSIGNTNDTYKLDVSGASRILASTYTSGAILYLRDAAATGSNTTFGGLFLGSSPGTDFVLGKQSTNAVGSFAIKTGGGTSLFTLSETGAATFSSSIHIPSSSSSGQGYYYFDYLSSAAASRTWRLAGDYNAYGDFVLQQSTTQTGSTFSNILRFDPTGAATFSSSVTAATESNFTGTSVNSRILVTASGVANIVLGFNNSGSTATGVSNNTGYVGILQAYPLAFITDSVERMRITSGGNVGIGTTSPSGRLHILNASGSGQPVLELQQSNAGSNILQWKGSAGSYLGVLTNDGNLGIGTTSPSEKLEVNGNIKTAAPSGGSAGSWKLGTFTSGSATIGGKVRVEINGVAYDLLTT